MTEATDLDAIRKDVALANRLLANEGVLDAFGHVSVRHPARRDRYLLSVAGPPALIRPEDVIEYDLDGRPFPEDGRAHYAERVIHAEIYRARLDVAAVCHHHAAAILPFCVSGVPLAPVSQLGAVIGRVAPFWDSRDDFGDTNLLLTRAEEGASLAAALGPHWIVLMRRHGATVVGTNLREMVYRAVHSTENAAAQAAAAALGAVAPLTPGEADRAGVIREGPVERCWRHWTARLAASGGDAA